MSYEQDRDYLQWCWTFREVTELLHQEVNPPDNLNMCEKPPQATASRLPACILAAVFSDGPPTAAAAATGIFDVRWCWAAGLGVEVGMTDWGKVTPVVANGGVGCETISGSLLTLPAHSLHSTSFVTWANLLLELMNKCCKVICSKGSQSKKASYLRISKSTMNWFSHHLS